MGQSLPVELVIDDNIEIQNTMSVSLSEGGRRHGIRLSPLWIQHLLLCRVGHVELLADSTAQHVLLSDNMSFMTNPIEKQEADANKMYTVFSCFDYSVYWSKTQRGATSKLS